MQRKRPESPPHPRPPLRSLALEPRGPSKAGTNPFRFSRLKLFSSRRASNDLFLSLRLRRCRGHWLDIPQKAPPGPWTARYKEWGPGPEFIPPLAVAQRLALFTGHVSAPRMASRLCQ